MKSRTWRRILSTEHQKRGRALVYALKLSCGHTEIREFVPASKAHCRQCHAVLTSGRAVSDEELDDEIANLKAQLVTAKKAAEG